MTEMGAVSLVDLGCAAGNKFTAEHAAESINSKSLTLSTSSWRSDLLPCAYALTDLL